LFFPLQKEQNLTQTRGKGVEVVKDEDWDLINARKRREYNLGMAKNGAIELLKWL
jgi:hypothetical protein